MVGVGVGRHNPSGGLGEKKKKKKTEKEKKKKERKRKENLSYPMKAQSWESSLGKHAESKKECKQPLKVTGNVC